MSFLGRTGWFLPVRALFINRGRGINRRRRCSGVRTKANRGATARVWMHGSLLRSFVLPSDGAVLRIFDDDTRIHELLPALVGALSVPPPLRRIPLVDEHFNLDRAHPRLPRAEPKLAQVLSVFVPEPRQDRV